MMNATKEKDMEGKELSINSIAESGTGSPEYREYLHLCKYFHQKRLNKLIRKIE